MTIDFFDEGKANAYSISLTTASIPTARMRLKRARGMEKPSVALELRCPSAEAFIELTGQLTLTLFTPIIEDETGFHGLGLGNSFYFSETETFDFGDVLYLEETLTIIIRLEKRG